MAAEKRLYKVTLVQDVFVVKAVTQHQAAVAVRKMHMTIEVLKSEQAFYLAQQGIKMIVSGEDASEQEDETDEQQMEIE